MKGRMIVVEVFFRRPVESGGMPVPSGKDSNKDRGGFGTPLSPDEVASIIEQNRGNNSCGFCE